MVTHAPLPRLIIIAAIGGFALLFTVPGHTQTTRPDPPTTPPADESESLSDREKIDALIELIGSSDDLIFIRNDAAHSAGEAAEHLQRKLDFAGGRIETAEQFIEHIASGSSTTGEPYRIRFADGTTVNSGPFLRELLARIEYEQSTDNPAAERFDLVGSDLAAMKRADEVMRALGGRDVWDDTRALSWKFFGRRLHVWDKHTGNARVEYDDQDGRHVVILMNLHSGEGSAFIDGEEIFDKGLHEYLQRGRSMWINDSYWLIMPYKLKDSGVTLKDLGERQTLEGKPAEVVGLTFDDVGDTPDNKYRVYIDPDTRLVVQWDFFREASQDEPLFQTEWSNWKRCGEIMLSDDRGVLRGSPARHTHVAVFDDVPETVFTDPSPLALDALIEAHAVDHVAQRPDDRR